MNRKNSFSNFIMAVAVVSVMLFIAPLTESSDEFAFKTYAAQTSGQCGENMYWSFDSSTGELVISGTGDMYYGQTAIKTTEVKKITIEKGVESVYSSFCNYYDALEEVYISETVKSIGSFYGCNKIKKIVVDDCNEYLKMKKSKKRFTYQDRYNKQKSIEMFLLIQERYNKKNNVEQGIKIWNGGCGYKTNPKLVKQSNEYYKKVMNVYEKKETI